MLAVLKNSTYRHLFVAQVIALAGTGFLTVALGLLAFELAGANAGVVLGTALAIKMVAYVGVAPIVGAFANQLPRRAFLVSMDLVRAAVALLLPFVTEVWQIYVLIFLLQSASAAFTPTFQATIPDVLPDEKDYTRALSLSRLAYDLESLLSPALAAALLTVISFHWLFGGTVVGFLGSAALVLSVRLPQPSQPSARVASTTRPRGDAHLPRDPAPTRAACTQPLGGGGGSYGHRQHRCDRPGSARPAGQRRCAGAGLLRRRLDGRGAGCRVLSITCPTARHVAGGRRAGRGPPCLHGRGLVGRRRPLAGAAGHLGAARPRLFRHPDPHRAAPAGLSTIG